MNFRFNLAKATEAACLFLERAGGQMNIMKLVKLLYLLDRLSLDRLSLDRRGIPVCGEVTGRNLAGARRQQPMADRGLVPRALQRMDASIGRQVPHHRGTDRPGARQDR